MLFINDRTVEILSKVPQFEDCNHFTGYLVNKYPMAKIPPASAMHMGKVKIHANAIFLTVAD